MIDYAYDHAVISDAVYAELKSECNFAFRNQSAECNQALNKFYTSYEVINIYSLYSPTCIRRGSRSGQLQLLQSGPVPGQYLLSKSVSSMICPKFINMTE